MRIALLAALLVTATAFQAEAVTRRITVVGESHQQVTPDYAGFTVNVQAEAREQAVAKKEHDEKLKKLIAIIDEYKIKDTDRTTNYASTSARYDWNDGRQNFVGYVAQSSIQVKLRELDKVGPMQQSLATAGFESVQGPDFSLDEASQHDDKVLNKALANAKEKAASLAKSVGETLGRPLTIVENKAADYQPPAPRMMMMAKGGAAEMADAGVAPPTGVIDVSAKVTATFELSK